MKYIMKGNVEVLKDVDLFKSFYNACVEAEKSILVSPATCAILSRRALELSVKWLYSFEDCLHIPYQDNLTSLVFNNSFVETIDSKLLPLIKYIIKLGNVAVHTNSNIKRDEAILALHNLHQFTSWIDYCYGDYKAEPFNEEILWQGEDKRTRPEELSNLYDKLSSKDRKLEEIRKENEKLRKQLTEKRVNNTVKYDFNVDELSEFKTRQKYIDIELKLAGW